MAEITYQLMLSTLQTVGLLVGIFYYVITLRNQQKARQIQTYLSLYNRLIDSKHVKESQEILRLEWDDYHDFETKYGTGADYELGARAI